MASVQILLATYNSSRFLDDLLRSLLAQDYSDFDLIVRDDGSTDDTIEILERYAEDFGGRLAIHRNITGLGGAISNFVHLIEISTADYILFADHDDVWRSAKVRKTIEGLQALEGTAERKIPAYWFSDAVPVDEALQPRNASFWASRNMVPSVAQNLQQCMICAVANGCMSGVNRALLDQALPVNADEIIGHDWYLTLVACAVGRVGWSTDKLMLYRQHGSNLSSTSHGASWKRFRSVARTRTLVRRGLSNRQCQAEALLQNSAKQMSTSDRQTVERFIALRDRGFLSRRVSILTDGFLYPDMIRNIGMLAFC